MAVLKHDMPAQELESQFHSLADRWRDEIGEQSSLSKIVSNRNYLRIIAMGERAVPLILKDLQREPAPWFAALQAITGDYELGTQHAGNFRKMADDWITWGKRCGYV